MESMGAVYAIVRKDGKALSVTSLNMTVKSLTAPDMDSALLVYASVSQAGKARYVSKVSINTC
jgi:membrane-bound inhibitor of C-type lysozyme